MPIGSQPVRGSTQSPTSGFALQACGLEQQTRAPSETSIDRSPHSPRLPHVAVRRAPRAPAPGGTAAWRRSPAGDIAMPPVHEDPDRAPGAAPPPVLAPGESRRNAISTIPRGPRCATVRPPALRTHRAAAALTARRLAPRFHVKHAAEDHPPQRPWANEATDTPCHGPSGLASLGAHVTTGRRALRAPVGPASDRTARGVSYPTRPEAAARARSPGHSNRPVTLTHGAHSYGSAPLARLLPPCGRRPQRDPRHRRTRGPDDQRS